MMAYVTDHAILMYLQRVEGVDVQGLRRRLTVEAIDTAAAFGCKTVKMGDGVRLKLRGDVVTTIYEARKHRRGGRPARIIVPIDAVDESPVADAASYQTATADDAYVPEGA